MIAPMPSAALSSSRSGHGRGSGNSPIGFIGGSRERAPHTETSSASGESPVHAAAVAMTDVPPVHTNGKGAGCPSPTVRRTLRVVIVDDDVGIRTLTRMILEHHEDVELVAESDGGDAVEVVNREQPDVVLLDLMMPKVDGRELLPVLVREQPSTMILVLSALNAMDEAGGTFARGAFAYLEKSILGPGLAEEILDLHQLFLRALAGETVWAPAGASRIRR